jgi:hypothetical protein
MVRSPRLDQHEAGTNHTTADLNMPKTITDLVSFATRKIYVIYENPAH